jgi:hypothetical protein
MKIQFVVQLFTSIESDLIFNLKYHDKILRNSLRESPNQVFVKINEIAAYVGKRYMIMLQIHFPDSSKIHDIESYGTENLSLVIDKFRKTFPISRDIVRSKAKEIFPESVVQDAYMYEGKEGLRVIMDKGRMEILPGSLHIWCKIDDKIRAFSDWLMVEVLYPKEKSSSNGNK